MAGPSSAFQYFRIFRSFFLSLLLDTQQFSSNIADSRNVGDNWSVSMLHSKISIAGKNLAQCTGFSFLSENRLNYIMYIVRQQSRSLSR